ncbi:hypothetical protein Tco_1221501 [Tanacetum coccineum]
MEFLLVSSSNSIAVGIHSYCFDSSNTINVATCFEAIPSLLSDIVPTALDTNYTIEFAAGKMIGTDSVIQGDEKIVRVPYDNEILIIQGIEATVGVTRGEATCGRANCAGFSRGLSKRFARNSTNSTS